MMARWMSRLAAQRSALVCFALAMACRERSVTETSHTAPTSSLTGRPQHEPVSPAPSASAEPQGFAPARSAGSHLCTLSSIASIAGEVRDTSGQPLCGATVAIESEGEWLQLYLSQQASFAAPRDRSGAFRISASRPGYSPVVLDAQVSSDGCHVKTRSVRLTLRRIAGTAAAEPCPASPSVAEAARGTHQSPYYDLPENPTPFVTRVQTEGLRAHEAGGLAARQLRFEQCWEENRPAGEIAPFYLGFAAQVLATGQVSVETPGREDPDQTPPGLRDCIARELSARPLLPPTGSGRFSIYLAFR
jgi:hypothetical protein